MNGLTWDKAKEIKVGQFFTLYEFLFSKGAEKRGMLDLQLEIEQEQIDNIKFLCSEILDKLRNQFGPIAINSGYRSPQYNEAIGGAKNSQHCNGEAADIDCIDNEAAFKYIKNRLWFDQNINEKNFSWIHVSKKRSGKNRMESFKIV